jgi:hypothetical protein
MKPLLPLLALAVSASAAAPTGILANQGKRKPVVTVANSYSEKVVRTFAGDADSGPVYEVQPGAEKVSAKVVALLEDDYDFGAINADTEVALRVGDFSFSGTLGEAGSRKLQATGNAIFTFNHQTPLLDADGGAKVDGEGKELFSVVKVGTLTWAWSATSKTVTVTLAVVIPGGGLIDVAGVTGIATAYFGRLGQQIPHGGERRFANQNEAGVSMRFGPSEGTRDAFVTGVTRTRLVKVPGAEAPYLTTSVVLAGGADTRGPQLAVRLPKKWVEGLAIPVFATLSDRLPPSWDSVSLDDPQAPDVAAHLGAVPTQGSGAFFTLDYRTVYGHGLPLGTPKVNSKGVGYLGANPTLEPGMYTLSFVAVDSQGNSTTVVKSVTVGTTAP